MKKRPLRTQFMKFFKPLTLMTVVIIIVVSFLAIGYSYAPYRATKTAIVLLEKAILGYRKQYGFLPFKFQKSNSDKILIEKEYQDLLEVLIGKNKNNMNKKGAKFLDLNKAIYKDVWNNNLVIVVDADSDGYIRIPSLFYKDGKDWTKCKADLYVKADNGFLVYSKGKGSKDFVFTFERGTGSGL